jgi:putative pyruvate formate lyase activating enzyme
MNVTGINNEYSSCNLCPRGCCVDRYLRSGYCGELNTLKVSRAALHMWEEPCISGKRGSGTVFFSGCNMGCVFCQNRKISRGETGKYISTERLSEIFFELRDKGANNINLVTGDMFIPSIREAIGIAKRDGFDLPFLLNTSSYLNVETIKSLEGYIDIYLPDFKYIRDEDAVRYSNAPGYPRAASAAIEEMVRQHPVCEFKAESSVSDIPDKPDNSKCTQDNMIMKKGVVIRHLLMPGMLIQAKMIVHALYRKYGDSVYISLMNQFTPNGELADFPEINRKVTGYEYHSLVEYARNLGITNCFVQVGDTAKESFIPEFDCRGV